MSNGARLAIVLAVLALGGCTVAPHGSKATHKVCTYQGRPDGLVMVEYWTDRSAGGGMLFFADPTLNNVTIVHTNSALHTGGAVSIGSATVIMDPNTANVIGAAGTAVGNIVGAALRSSAGLPKLP